MEPQPDHESPRTPLAATLTRLRWMGRRIAYGLPIHWRAGRQRASAPPEYSGPLAAFRRYNRAYFQRWVFLGILIGIGAGVSMILFFSALKLCTHLFLGSIAGFMPPEPSGEGATVIAPIAHRWLIPVVTTLGGLLTGLLVYSLAPETARGGTDHSIQAFHKKNGRLRGRVPAVKLVASAITIGSGGSAGREGAAAQIMAGIGSWIGNLLHLDDHDRRIAVVAGIGSGIGTIFRAPFAGALFSAEVLYKRDFEADALFPTFIAAVVGYAIYGAWEGWVPVFGNQAHFTFEDPRSLGGFLILGIVAGLIGLLFHWAMHTTHRLFARLPLPAIAKPAIGGLLVGLVGIALPQALGMGYGFVQFGVNNDYTHLTGLLLGVLVFAKILTTALTIGSGGSGGDVAPAMVVGGFLGGALWAAIHAVAPALVLGVEPGAFVVVGMAAFFGGISKTPLAMILMVAEMTGQLSLIVPAMLATMVAYLVTGDTSIYEEQVPTRLDSPAHKNDYALPLLQSLLVSDAMSAGLSGALATAGPDTPVPEIARILRERRVSSVPIIRDGRLVGVVTSSDIARMPADELTVSRARQVMSRALIRAFPDESLYAAWLRMSRRGLRQLAVVDRADPSQLVGMITATSIAQLLRPPTAPPRGIAPLQAPSTAPMARAPNDTTDATTDATVEEEDDEPGGVGAAAGADQQESQPVGGAAQVATAQEHAQAEAVAAASLATDGDPLAHICVAEAMLATPRLVRAAEPLGVARALLEQRGNALMVVDDAGLLVGIVTRSDLHSRADREGDRMLTIGDVAVRNLVTITPTETLRVAARRMSRLGLRQLPVVQSELPTPPLGLLRRSDILAAYERTLADDSTKRQTVSPPAR